MARKPRVFVPYGLYHVYSRVGRGEPVFESDDEADHWVRTVRRTAKVHELKILAWCLMSNHYHLVLRSGPEPIWRPMAKIQRQASRYHNLRLGERGRMWQSRYKARLVLDEAYFEQVVAYVHLNPVAAGLVDDPADYLWSGHRELIGQNGSGLIDVRESLLTFGRNLGDARKGYLDRVRQIQEERWLRRSVRRLPWWKSTADNEQTADEDHTPEEAVGFDGARLALREADRVDLSVLQEWFEDVMPAARGRLTAGTRSRRDCYVRQLFTVISVVELGHASRDVAAALHRNSGSVSRWLSDGLSLWRSDPTFQHDMERLIRNLSAELLRQ